MTTQIHSATLDHAIKVNQNELIANILQEIRVSHSGSISFERFMDLALYTPGLGYYRRGVSPIHASGDFITAPEISPLFAQSLARQLADILKQFDAPHIIEVGAGNGTLAADLLNTLATREQCFPQYFIREPDRTLAQLQYETIKRLAPERLQQVHWQHHSDMVSFSGVVIANELFDAQPVPAWSWREGELFRREVCWQDDQFAWCLQKENKNSAELHDIMACFSDSMRQWYDFERNINAPALLTNLLQQLQQGVVFIIDYGYARTEYYHPQRMYGHILRYSQHRVANDVLNAPGESDLTVHVDFTHLAEIAHSQGAQILGFTSQANFLLNCGFLEDVTQALKTSSDRERLQVQQAVQLLTSPAEMGEMVKVLALGWHYVQPLRGFACGDGRHRL